MAEDRVKLITILDGRAVLTEEGKAIGALRELGKMKFANHLKWVYFVYSRNSPYRNLFPGEKKTRVHREQDFTPHSIEELDTEPAVLEAMNALDLEMVPPERFRQGCIKKMEELINHWNNMKPDDKNFNSIFSQLKGAGGLIDMYEQWNKQSKEVMKRNRGGVKLALFEQPKA